MVLRGDWLIGFNHVLFDFVQAKISFVRDGKRVELGGVPEKAGLIMLRGVEPKKHSRKKVQSMIKRVASYFALEGSKKPIPVKVRQVLYQYKDMKGGPAELSNKIIDNSTMYSKG